MNVGQEVLDGTWLSNFLGGWAPLSIHIKKALMFRKRNLFMWCNAQIDWQAMAIIDHIKSFPRIGRLFQHLVVMIAHLYSGMLTDKIQIICTLYYVLFSISSLISSKSIGTSSSSAPREIYLILWIQMMQYLLLQYFLILRKKFRVNHICPALPFTLAS